MANAQSPDLMTASERLAEIGDILARGLIRLHARQSSSVSTDLGESLLDRSPRRSGHAHALSKRKGAR